MYCFKKLIETQEENNLITKDKPSDHVHKSLVPKKKKEQQYTILHDNNLLLFSIDCGIDLPFWPQRVNLKKGKGKIWNLFFGFIFHIPISC